MSKIMVNRKVIEKLPRLLISGHNNGGVIYIKDSKTLIKLFDPLASFLTEKERNATFLSVTDISCPKPMDILYDENGFAGYTERYIKRAKTFKSEINKPRITLEQKFQIITDIYKPLSQLNNRNIYLGDIHLDNFIFNNEGGYLIDLDDVRFKGLDDFKFMEYYCIKKNNKCPSIKVASSYTDNAKAVICFLSLIYNENFEEIARAEGLDEIMERIFCYASNNIDLLNLLKKVFYQPTEQISDLDKQLIKTIKSR